MLPIIGVENSSFVECYSISSSNIYRRIQVSQ